MSDLAARALPAVIPSPSTGEWSLLGIPLRAYALLIVAGILVALWYGGRRYVARGGPATGIGDMAIWAVPFGIVGGRLYHVVTDNQLYFGEGRNPVDALKIWEGGLGIWGAIALGGVGAWIGARRAGLALPPIADAIAPAILVAQAIGRWGNYFNQELFGRPTDLPWALEIDPGNRPQGFADAATYHPTFLYESLWCLLIAAVIVAADRRWQMGHGRVFALYVALYTVGRGIIETVRIDPANELAGLRINVWVSGLVFIGAVLYIVISARRRPGRETPAELRLGPSADQPDTAGSAAVTTGTTPDPAPDADPDAGPDAGPTSPQQTTAGAEPTDDDASTGSRPTSPGADRR